MAGALTIDEVIDLHHGEWVLMRVAEYDEESWPLRGHVLAHSPRHEDLIPVLEREPVVVDGAAQPQPLRGSYYTFRAYPMERSGPEFEAAVTAFAVGLIGGKASDE